VAEPVWESAEYRRIRSASLDGALRVGFANGDNVEVPLERLLPPEAATAAEATVSHGPSDVVVSIGGDEHEISWMDIRAQSDDAFNAYLVQEADAEARRIGQSLRALRLRRGMTAKDVAEAAELAPMSLSRIERGEHDVVYRTLRRLLAAMGYSLSDLAETAQSLVEPEGMAKRLRALGIPVRIITQWRTALADQPERIYAAAERVFGWSPAEIASGVALSPRIPLAAAGRFKSQVNQRPELATYTFWAHWLAGVVDQAVERPPAEVPENPLAIREDILATRETVDFDGLLDWSWAHGIAVVPLQDPGEFHGACWTFDGRAVIVLKQRTPARSRWAFDLAHELAHVARHLDQRTTWRVELWDPVSSEAAGDDDEQEANDFAGALLLGDANGLAEELVVRTQQRLPRLKQQVISLADERSVPVGSLANYMAYRLALEGENWWGTASNLQEGGSDAPFVARERLLAEADLGRITEDDAALVRAALDWSHL
jgi:transcriptional regulator with XRE-family HTH domain